MVHLRSNPRLKSSIFTPTHNAVILEDPDDGHMSITNDVEAVARRFHQMFSVNGKPVRIYYFDTQGDLAEIEHVDGVFKCFRPVKDGDLV